MEHLVSDACRAHTVSREPHNFRRNENVNRRAQTVLRRRQCRKRQVQCASDMLKRVMQLKSRKPNDNRPLELREVRPKMKLYGIIQCDSSRMLCLLFAQDSRGVAAVYCCRPNHLLHNACRSTFSIWNMRAYGPQTLLPARIQQANKQFCVCAPKATFTLFSEARMLTAKHVPLSSNDQFEQWNCNGMRALQLRILCIHSDPLIVVNDCARARKWARENCRANPEHIQWSRDDLGSGQKAFSSWRAPHAPLHSTKNMIYTVHQINSCLDGVYCFVGIVLRSTAVNIQIQNDWMPLMDCALSIWIYLFTSAIEWMHKKQKR